MWLKLFCRLNARCNLHAATKEGAIYKWKLCLRPQIFKIRQFTQKSTESQKAFVLYHYNNFPINYARGSVAAGLAGLLSCAIAVSKMREFPDEVDSNGRQTKGPFNVYGGRNAYIIPPICLLLSFGLWWGVAKLATSILKKVMVSPDRKVLTFVTYRLIGKENIISVPVGSANLKGQGQIIINTQGLNKKHFLTSEGVITNQALFRSVLGVYRDPKLDL